ncbi:hypothetical protein [Methylobacter tundripaludum]|uniref:hypothetical protein n=1 Tax=Methylobacter tundripaludum TaxID=173365 RepID=UPI0004DEE8EC|nr:hypothetical protein [Methylobacter tundripaludum]
MITQQITDALHSNALDVSTVAGLVFLVFLTIYFFVAIKPGLDSKIRVNRQVQRCIERDKVNEKYQKIMIKQQLGKNAKAFDVERVFKQQQATKAQKKPYEKNKGYYSKDKGYQAFIKHNSIKTNSAQIKKHNVFKKAASIKINSDSGSHSKRLAAHNDKVNVSNRNFKNWHKTQTPEQLKNPKIWSK